MRTTEVTHVVGTVFAIAGAGAPAIAGRFDSGGKDARWEVATYGVPGRAILVGKSDNFEGGA